MAEAPPSHPERQIITQVAGVSLYLSGTEQPWLIPAQALVLPMGPRAGMNGRLARAYRGAFDAGEEGKLRSMLQASVKEESGAGGLIPGHPVLVPLPEFISWPPGEPQLYKGAPAERYLIAATAYAGQEATLEGAAEATGALVRLASSSGVRSLILPTLGTGQGGLPSDQVMLAMAAALQSALLGSAGSHVEEITLITLDPGGARAAFDFFNNRSQRLLNDLPTGDDLLGVAIEAQALTETLLLRDVEPPLSVAVVGGWGSGKSFIMHLMQKHMQELRARELTPGQTWPSAERGQTAPVPFPYVGHIYPIKFDAWTYAKGNLWASLMTTILFELNRQLSLEKRMREAAGKGDAAVEIMLEGRLWRALSEMDEPGRNALLESDFPELFERWKKGAADDTGDTLWTELIKLRKEEQKRLQKTLKATEKAVTAQQAEVHDKQGQLAETVAALKDLDRIDIRAKAEEQVLAGLQDKVIAAVGVNAFNQLAGQLKAATAAEGEVGDANLDAVKPNTLRIFMDEVLTKPSRLRWFLALLWVGTAAFLLSILINALLPELVSALVALGTFLAAGVRYLSPWLTKVSQTLEAWDNAILEVYKTYQSEVGAQYKALQEKKEQDIGQKEKDKRKLEQEIADAESELTKLNAELEQQRHRLSPLASYDSLLQFISSRLSGTYEPQLGFVHTVQRDLQDLTDCLSADLDKPERIPQRLRDLFPRGPARIVLFIDDLDRCPPPQVVEVLEAAQLLLKTPLFVVVLAIDVRYVARALEKAYDKILVRRGKPSGLDYVEKIIQIPYRVRSIDQDGIGTYLHAQMQVSEAPAPTGIVQAAAVGGDGQASAFERSLAAARAFEVPPPRVLEFSPGDLEKLQEACQWIDLSPRAIKRIINVSKIIKVVWFRSRFEPSDDTVRGVFGLLALSDRFPDLFRDIFDEMAAYWRLPGSDPTVPLRVLINQLANEIRKQPQEKTYHLQHEWENLLKVVDGTALVPPGLCLSEMGLRTFNLVRSFCFVGDIGYDPRDERQGAARE